MKTFVCRGEGKWEEVKGFPITLPSFPRLRLFYTRRKGQGVRIYDHKTGLWFSTPASTKAQAIENAEAFLDREYGGSRNIDRFDTLQQSAVDKFGVSPGWEGEP